MVSEELGVSSDWYVISSHYVLVILYERVLSASEKRKIHVEDIDLCQLGS